MQKTTLIKGKRQQIWRILQINLIKYIYIFNNDKNNLIYFLKKYSIIFKQKANHTFNYFYKLLFMFFVKERR